MGMGPNTGLSANPLHHTWYLMIRRCENPCDRGYKNYGGHGIKVCDQWHDVRTFLADIDSLIGTRPEGMTLDRIDNDGNYEPGNVRWATPRAQYENSRLAIRHAAARGSTTLPVKVKASKTRMVTMESDPFIQRALAAYYQRAAREGTTPQIPANSSYVTRLDSGCDYVVLENSKDVLAVYRIRTNGRLKYLRRPPAELLAAV